MKHDDADQVPCPWAPPSKPSAASGPSVKTTVKTDRQKPPSKREPRSGPYYPPLRTLHAFSLLVSRICLRLPHDSLDQRVELLTILGLLGTRL